MSTAETRSRITSELRSCSRLGKLLCLAAALVILGWGGTAQLAGAVLATGRVAVESQVKQVQHQLGGIVVELPVRDGDFVRSGQIVARLDPTVPQASARAASEQFDQLNVRRLRLLAQIRGQSAFSAPLSGTSPQYPRIVEAERLSLAAEMSNQAEKKQQLAHQIEQLKQQLIGSKAQLASATEQHRLSEENYGAVQRLYKEGAAALLQLNEMARERERLVGQRGELAATIQRLNAQASEVRVQMLQVDSEKTAQLYQDLKDTEIKLAQTTGQKAATDFEAGNVTLRAPAAGRVHQLSVHTKGGVIRPGESLMQIVPVNDSLIVDANVEPTHVDDVRVGGRAFVRLVALSARTTPELVGIVDSVSPETKTDERSGVAYYTVKLRLDAATLPTDVRHKLVPGMPVEVQVETPSRTALNYLTKPLFDQVYRAFKED